VRIYCWRADLKGAGGAGRRRGHQDDKVFGESVRLQSPLNIRTKLSGERASTISLSIVMLSAPMCGSTRRSEAPPSSSYDRSRYVRLHTRTTIGAVRIYCWRADLKGVLRPRLKPGTSG